MIAYAELFGLDTRIYYNSADHYRYNHCVFWFKGWKDIYRNDDERKMNFQQAYEFGKERMKFYRKLDTRLSKFPYCL